MQWPRGYSYVPGGELETRTESFGGIAVAHSSSPCFGIFAILVLEFGNFKSTLIVLTVVPLGIARRHRCMLAAHRQHDLVHRDHRLHRADRHRDQELDPAGGLHQPVCAREGVPLDEAIEQAGEIRFLPILLTSATAIGGLLPLALQNSAMYSPLAWVIIGGLLSSTCSPASSRRRCTS